MNLKTILLKEDLSNCSGCGACVIVCPQKAIAMEKNYYGCLYPVIDADQCIQCGKCVRVCGFHTPVAVSEPMTAFAAVGRNKKLVCKSASGGVFASLAETFLHSGGLVAGAVMECGAKGAAVFHILSDRPEDLPRLQGSKYVQSDAWRCYAAVQDALKEGKQVLFSGTPCQVAAIKGLTGDPENLITMDLICHGVPSQQMLNDHIKFLQTYLGGTVTDICFRDKSAKKMFTARVETRKNGTVKKHSIRSMYLSYYSMFLEGSIYRESCYTCPYAGPQRASDLTIGDYWGIKDHHGPQLQSGEMPDQKDWSCILVNTEKGRSFLAQYPSALECYPTESAWVRQQNQQLNRPSKKTENREAILESYEQKGYGALEKMFVKKHGGFFRYHWRLRKNMRMNGRNKGA